MSHYQNGVYYPDLITWKQSECATCYNALEISKNSLNMKKFKRWREDYSRLNNIF